MTRRCLFALLFLVASPALAFDANKLGQGGSLALSDLNELIAQSAPLKREVADALAASKKEADDIICLGNRFPREWVNLGGMRAAPYTCRFADKWLIIEATTRPATPTTRSRRQ